MRVTGSIRREKDTKGRTGSDFQFGAAARSRREQTISCAPWRAPKHLAVPLALALATAPLGLGCLSNEYRIPKDELWRQAQLPVEARGQRVRVVQKLGQRRDDAVNPDQYTRRAEPAGPEEPPRSTTVAYVDVGGWGPGGEHVYASGPMGRTSVGRSPGAGAAPRLTAPTVRGSAGGGAGAGALGGCCGGGKGSGTDALVVLAVVVVGVALIGTVGLAASEGARFDGFAAVAPEQLVYLKDDRGRVTERPLAMLSEGDVAGADEATIMDDEGAGLRLLDRAPLDRKGGAFKLDVGTSAFNLGTSRMVGPVANIQAGVFLTRHVGVLAEVGLSGGSDCCGSTIVRHSLSLEIDALPVALGRLHAGVFAKGGATVVGDATHRAWGPLLGGGALLELDLTPRLALVVRGGTNAALVNDAWSTAGTLTAGLAIY